MPKRGPYLNWDKIEAEDGIDRCRTCYIAWHTAKAPCWREECRMYRAPEHPEFGQSSIDTEYSLIKP